MKIKSKLIPVAIAVSLLTIILGSHAFAAGYAARLDSINGNTISGWAWNSEIPDHTPAVTIHILRQGTNDIIYQTTVSASEHRDDLIAAGKGDGCHGFTAYVDWNSLDAGSYLVQAIVDNQYSTNIISYTNGNPAAAQPISQGTSLGNFKTTAYCPCRSCSGRWGRNTSTGAIASANHTVAVDPKVIPYGTKLMINGIVYTAEDRGGGVKGRHIDIFYNTHGETVNHGVRQMEVYVIR